MRQNRLLFVSGVLCAAMGAGGIVPAIAGWLGRGAWQWQGLVALAVGMALIAAGACVIWGALRGRSGAGVSVPPPVRAVMAANILFLTFCALETSDGLVLRNGRIVYWTTFLFVPALTVLYGHVLAQRWAWWVARVVAALAAVWFLVFIGLIPFVDLRGPAGPAPWWGRIYAAGVSLVFASIAGYAFHWLGRADARKYFGLVWEVGNSSGAVEASAAS